MIVKKNAVITENKQWKNILISKQRYPIWKRAERKGLEMHRFEKGRKKFLYIYKRYTERRKVTLLSVERPCEGR